MRVIPVVFIQYTTMKQPVHTQCSIMSKKLHVSAVWNYHHQASQLRNTKRKSYSQSHTFNSKSLCL